VNLRYSCVFLLLGGSLFSSVALFGREKSDVVVMQNGDRFTCEIKGLDAGVLYVSIDYVDGTISVDWTKVAHLESSQSFIVKDENGFAYTGVLNSTKETARPITLQVAEPGGQSVELRADRVVKLGETSDRFWQRFNGYTSLGFIFSKGNETSQLNVSSETEYLREQWAAHAFYNSSLSAASGESVSTRNQVGFDGFRRLPKENYFYGGRVDFLQSSEEQIKLQTSVGVGLGRFLRDSNQSRVSVLGGLAWQNTLYDQRVFMTGQNLAAAMIVLDARIFRFSKMNLTFKSSVFPAISSADRGRVRFNTNVSYYVKLTSDLSWTVSFYGNWDNRPPLRNSGSDYGSSVGLSWTYGYK